MKTPIFFLPAVPYETDEHQAKRLSDLCEARNLLEFVSPKDMVAIKTHFGEDEKSGFVRPPFFTRLGALVRERGGLPFLTETQTLYCGNRNNAVVHLETAYRHGFSYEKTGIPIIMADGLLGDEEIAVPIPGKLYQKVNLAALIVKAQALIVVSHFTGHLASGFGAALKNMGMGCASRRGKLLQHSTATPSVREKKCTQCSECIRWCPQDAIRMGPQSAVIDADRCIGCAECLAVCRFDAIGYNWSETYEQLQRKIVEHALGVFHNKKEKALYINVLTRISKDCDCMRDFQQIAPDIGILVSFDPVALDAASLDLVEKAIGRELSAVAYNIPYRVQLQHAQALQFGNPDYELVTV